MRDMVVKPCNDLAVKPYIPQKIYFDEFVANVLHDNIGIKS